MALKYEKAQTKRLRELGFDERWLQERIADDPSILTLGDLSVIERERSQPSGGRIDFLMYDPEEDGLRYVIEVMLGDLNESHIIRTIEYWDTERRRFPTIEHRAVIVAENVTGRFSSVLTLLNGPVPLIVLQLSAFQLESRVVLHFTKVMDIVEPGLEEEAGGAQAVDRAYWERRASSSSLAVVDAVVELVPTTAGPVRVTYNKNHIAVGTTGNNFLWFYPRKVKGHCFMNARLEGDEKDEAIARLSDAGLHAGSRRKVMKARLDLDEVKEHLDLVRGLVELCERNSHA